MSNYCYTCEIVNEVTGEVEPCWCNDEWRAVAPAPTELKEWSFV